MLPVTGLFLPVTNNLAAISNSAVVRSCYIFTLRCIFSSGLYWFSSKEVFIKSLNGVGKEKKLYAKKWYKKELV
jgi:hypothetical protein